MTLYAEPLEFIGAPGSPYSRKMLALLRYRRIPYAVHWTSGKVPGPDYPKPKVGLLPTFYFPSEGEPGSLEAVIDSTPIIRRLEALYPARSVIPDNPALAFLNELIEDYGDEWMTKMMFHYRWAHAADYANAGPMLVYWADHTLGADAAAAQAAAFSKRQYDRLYVVGSNDVTAPTIEASYERLLGILDQLLAHKGFVLGARPSSADFALYGQLTQLGIVEPTPGTLMRQRTLRVRAWLDIMEDLSGHHVADDQWFMGGDNDDDVDDVGAALRPLLAEIGRTYAPFLIGNAKAAMAGKGEMEAEIDGRPWTQPTFPYQVKCLAWLREAYSALNPQAKAQVDEILTGTGCEILFE